MAKKKISPASLEPDILARYQNLLDEEAFRAMLQALAEPVPQGVRLNPLKVDPASAMADWSGRYGWQAQPVSFCPSGWQISAAQTLPSRTIEFQLGQYYIQDAASMLPAELLDFSGLDAPLILDLAASPGGKTTHLVSRSRDRGLVLANDSGPGRIQALRGVLRDWGAINIAITNFPGERFGSWYPETFDLALLDAPCSMENLRPGGAHPRRSTSARERDSLAQRQLHLLDSAFRALKPGGQVVYSTCTLAPEEDEAVLDGLLQLYPGMAHIEDVSSRLPRPAPGLAANEQREFDPAVRQALRLWPHSLGTPGFFAALITKTTSVETQSQEPPMRPIERVGWARLGPRPQAELATFFIDTYGFDLPAVLDRQGLALWRRGEGVHAVPELYTRWFAGLPLEGLGLLLGEETSQGFVLSHEWAARFGQEFQRGLYPLPIERVAGWVRGEDLPGSPDAEHPAGQIVLLVDPDGRILGRGKIQAQRVKNLLPRRLV